MPKCCRCWKLFHPDYCVTLDENDKAHSCIFCHTGKKEITIEDTETGEPIGKVTKELAEENYILWLKDMSERPNVRKIVRPDKKG